MKHPARWIALGVAAVVVVLGVILALNVGNDPQLESKNNRLLGRDAPAFNLPTLTASRVTRDELAGKAVIVNFWNTWCIPCQQELPALKAFYQAHANDPDFAMVGIVRDAQKSKSGIADYVRKQGMDWTIALDPESQRGARLRDAGTARDLRDHAGRSDRRLPARRGDQGEPRDDARRGARAAMTRRCVAVARARGRRGGRAGRRSCGRVAARATRRVRTSSRPSCDAPSARACRWPTATRRRRRRSAPTSSVASPTARATPRSGRATSTSTTSRSCCRPQSSGLGLIVWVLPVLVLALGAVGIWFALARASPRAAPPRHRRRRGAGRPRSEGSTHDRRPGRELEQERDFLLKSLDDLESRARQRRDRRRVLPAAPRRLHGTAPRRRSGHCATASTRGPTLRRAPARRRRS